MRERILRPTRLLLRGSPLSAAKFAEHAARTARAYPYRGQSCRGISVEVSGSAEETAQLLQGRRLSARRLVARIRVEDARALGFVLLLTFAAPHCTVVIERTRGATVDALVALATADVIENPYLSVPEGGLSDGRHHVRCPADRRDRPRLYLPR